MLPRLRIFISSPGDVPDERLRADLVIDKLGQDYNRFFALESFRWEHEPMLASGHFQDAVEPPSQFDIVILILWSRLGTPLPDHTAMRAYHGIDGRTPVTGTEWEYEDALAAARARGAPDILAFRNVSPAPVDPQDAGARARSNAQLDSLDAFWKRHFADRGMFLAAYDEYRSLDEFTHRLEQSLRKLIERRIKAAVGASTAALWIGEPFRGLAGFELEHAPIYFGRDGIVAKAIEQLAVRARSGTAFLMVCGPSGSGKSSLVKAAIVPRLMKPQRIEGAAFLRRAVFRPSDGGADVIAGLIETLAQPVSDGVGLPEVLAPGQSAGDLARHLRATADQAGFVFAGALGRVTQVARTAHRLLAYEEAKLVLVIDQLEEIFTRSGISAEEQRLFMRLVRALAGCGSVWVIATLRSDFWHRAAELPELMTLAEGPGRLDLSFPSPAELAEMIRKPAQAAGLSFEMDNQTGLGLDAELAQSAAVEPRALPLLSFTLDALYAEDIGRHGGRVLTYDTYRALGCLEGAIATRADGVLAELPEGARAAVPRVLRALVAISPGTERGAVSRSAPLASFPEGSAERSVVDALTAARLLVAAGDRNGPTVRLAHEALISSWGRAREQLAADRRDLETRTIVEQQRARYAAASGSTPRQLLLRDPDLANAVDLDRRWGDELDAPMREFIAGSRRQARRRQQFTRAAAGVFALLACIAAVAAWQARQSQQRASRTFNLAIEQSDALVTKIGDELQDLAGVSKDAIRRILQVVEGELVQIAQIDPDNTRLILSRAATLSVVSENYVDLGDFTVATDRAEKCTDLARPVSERSPSYVDAARVLARCLQALGYAETQSGDVNSAGTAYRESIALRRRVLASAPDDAAALDDLSRGLNLYASSQLKAKAYVEARETAQESIGIAQRLVAADPNNNNYQREDVDSRNILSIALFWLGQREAASAGFTDLLALARTLASNSRDNATWQRYLSNIVGNAGIALFQLGQRDEGISALKEGLDLKRSLVRGDPGNVTWLSELTDLLLQYAAAILASTPPNANAQTTASVDRMKDALAIYQEALGDTRTLLARDPANITWQLNMISCLGNIALLQARTRDPRAPASREQALAAIAKLDRTKLNGDQQGFIDAFQTELSK